MVRSVDGGHTLTHIWHPNTPWRENRHKHIGLLHKAKGTVLAKWHSCAGFLQGSLVWSACREVYHCYRITQTQNGHTTRTDQPELNTHRQPPNWSINVQLPTKRSKSKTAHLSGHSLFQNQHPCWTFSQRNVHTYWSCVFLLQEKFWVGQWTKTFIDLCTEKLSSSTHDESSVHLQPASQWIKQIHIH